MFVFAVIIQFILTALLLVVLFETLVELSYRSYLIIAAISLSYVPSIIYLSVLSERFIRWLINNRSYVSMLFGFSTLGILINTSLSFLYIVNILTAQPSVIKFHIGILIQTVSGSSYILQSLYSTSFLISYLLTWVSTVMILKNYSRKLGKAKFWLMVTLPLMYIIGQFEADLG